MGGIFRTIGNTWQIIKLSWRVLQLDRELIVFPILGAIGAAAVAGTLAIIFGATNRFASGAEVQFGGVDIALTLIAYFTALYAVIFCNSALVAAARERLEGGDPNVASGFRAVRGMWLAILGWTLITGTVGLILQALQAAAQNQESPVARIVGQILIAIIGAIWAYITFFVIPVLVVERIGPIEAIRRSSRLLKSSWGEQITANFSFGLLYLVAALVAAVPAIVLALVAPAAIAVIVGVVLVGLAIAAVSAMEGIFKAALYEWVSVGKGSEWFDTALLREAWSPRV